MIKQVILIRKDLKMRRGKEIAQGAHASMKFLANKIQDTFVGSLSADEIEWLSGKFTKICLQVESEEELLGLHHAAAKAGLTAELIQDAGATEFNGVPTYTAVAIGPNDSEAIDKITGHLKLY